MGSFWLAEAVQALIDMTSWSWKFFGGDRLGGDILGGDSLGGNNFGDESFCGDSFGGDSLCGDSHPWWCYRWVCSCIYWWTRSYGLTAVRLSVHLSIYPSIRLWSRLTLMDVLKMAYRPLIYWRTHCISPAIVRPRSLPGARAAGPDRTPMYRERTSRTRRPQTGRLGPRLTTRRGIGRMAADGALFAS